MPEGIGDTLRATRERHNLALEDAARDTRIRREHLLALEEERFGALGGDVYAKGFLRTYARWLGLDPEPLVDRYKREVSDVGYDPHILAEHPVARPPRKGLPVWVAWAGVGVVVLFVAFAVVGTLGGRTPDPAAVPDPEVTAPDDEPPSTPAPIESSPEPEPTPEGIELVLIFEEVSWVRVTIDGIVVTERTVPAGETLVYEHTEAVRVRLGDSGGVTMRLNGETIGSPAGRGVVWEGICTPDGCAEV